MMRKVLARWQVLLGVVGAGFGGLFGWLALRGQDWSQVPRELEQASIPGLLLSLPVVFAAGLLRAYRLRLFFVREHTTVVRLYLVEQAGTGANNLSPVRFLAEPLVFGLLSLRDRLRAGDILASLSLHRTTDLVVMLALMAAGLTAFPVPGTFIPFLASAAVLGVPLLLSPFLLIPISRAVPTLRRSALVNTFLEAANAIAARKGRILLAVALGLAHWLAVGIVGWLTALAMGISLPIFIPMVVTVGTLFFTNWVPGLPGALGTFEVAAVFLLGLWDVPREEALSFALVLHLILFLPPTLIAAIVLPLEGVRSVAAIRHLVSRYWDFASRVRPL